MTITISPAAGGKVVKTITIAQPVASDRDSRVSFVCHLKAGRYVWTVHAIDGLLRVPTIVRSAHLTIVSVSPSAAAIARTSWPACGLGGGGACSPADARIPASRKENCMLAIPLFGGVSPKI